MNPTRERNLRIPGPTPLPEPVRVAAGAPMINHRGGAFRALLRETCLGIADFMGTQRDVLLLTVSGTGGLEAAVVNTLSPGDVVVATVAGLFGQRSAAIARAFGVDVRECAVEWGHAVSPAQLDAALASTPEARAALITYNETSTGVTQQLPDLVRVAHDHSALTLVDGVSGIGALPFFMDEWGVDVAVTSSQKAWMAPPGIAMLALSDRAWEANESARCPRYYLDLRTYQKALADGISPFTPAISVVSALHESIALMQREGREAIWERHHTLAESFREGLTRIGLELLPSHPLASDTVTAIRVPPGFGGTEVVKRLLDEYGIVVATGQGHLRDFIIRVGHMGCVTTGDLDEVLHALADVMGQRGSMPAEVSRASSRP